MTTWLSERDVLAIDCEMVGVVQPSVNLADSPGISNALCRVSIVSYRQEQGCKVILDTWVEVPDRIVDFRSAITGINGWTFKGKRKMTFDEVQRRVRSIITGRVVVGHALWNDFEALNIEHPEHLIRDTALYPGLRPPWASDRLPSLRSLAKHWLSFDMHRGTHDSVEDAMIPLRLYKMHQGAWERSLGNECAEHEVGGGMWTEPWWEDEIVPAEIAPFSEAVPVWGDWASYMYHPRSTQSSVMEWYLQHRKLLHLAGQRRQFA